MGGFDAGPTGSSAESLGLSLLRHEAPAPRCPWTQVPKDLASAPRARPPPRRRYFNSVASLAIRARISWGGNHRSATGGERPGFREEG